MNVKVALITGGFLLLIGLFSGAALYGTFLCPNTGKAIVKQLEKDGDAIIEECFGMGGEDFAYMAQSAPGAMFLLGAQVPGGGNHHTPVFDIDETVLPMGSAVLAETARRFVT